MQVGLEFGHETIAVEIADDRLVGMSQPVSAGDIGDVPAAVRMALELPIEFPALRRALTPDDHVVIVLSERFSHWVAVLTALLEHLASAKVFPETISLIACRPLGSDPRDYLDSTFRTISLIEHDPTNSRQLSYLATTKKGRRIYLNRAVVDADQVVVVSPRRYDPLFGYSGAEVALFPALSDTETMQSYLSRLHMEPPGEEIWPVQRMAQEVAWLLGAPFSLQVIEGAGNSLAHVIGGLMNTSAEGQRRLNARWKLTADRAADLVIACIGGNPELQDFAAMSRALASATRVVKSGGRIALLTHAEPCLGPAFEILRQANSPADGLKRLIKQMPPDMPAAFQWAQCTQQATVYLRSRLADDIAEELSTTPITRANEVQRLIDGAGSCLILRDAQRTLALPRS